MPGRQKKDPFEKLNDAEPHFQDTVAGMGEAEIRNRIAQIALNQAELMQQQEKDDDLAQKKEAASDASAVYRDGSKLNKLKIQFCKQVLEDRGIATTVDSIEH